MQVRFLPCKVNFPITSDYQILRKQEKHSWQTVSRKKKPLRKVVTEQIAETHCGNYGILLPFHDFFEKFRQIDV